MSGEKRPYTVQFSETSVKSLRRYLRDDQRRILERIEELAADPTTMRGVKRLVEFDVTYRLRVGD